MNDATFKVLVDSMKHGMHQGTVSIGDLQGAINLAAELYTIEIINKKLSFGGKGEWNG